MSSYFTKPPALFDGDTAYADDVNELSNRVDSGFSLVQVELGDGVPLAIAAATEARLWATEVEDTEVVTGKYSAYHYAQKASGVQQYSVSAAASAVAATTKAAEAVVSASAAAASAVTAASAATTATGAASEAEGWASIAQDNSEGLATLNSPAFVGTPTAPTASLGTKNTQVATTAYTALVSAPVGSVVSWIGGYFTDTSNGGFTSVLGNTAATANTYLNPSGWYVCNGAAVNMTLSPIFNGLIRHLPNITDERFLMGFTSSGTIGGENASSSHTHTTPLQVFDSGSTTLTISQIPSHTHSLSISSGGAHTHTLDGGVTTGGSSLGSGGSRADKLGVAESAGSHSHSGSIGSSGTGGSHLHSITVPELTTSEISALENRPKFLSCLYIMKVI